MRGKKKSSRENFSPPHMQEKGEEGTGGRDKEREERGWQESRREGRI